MQLLVHHDLGIHEFSLGCIKILESVGRCRRVEACGVHRILALSVVGGCFDVVLGITVEDLVCVVANDTKAAGLQGLLLVRCLAWRLMIIFLHLLTCAKVTANYI